MRNIRIIATILSYLIFSFLLSAQERDPLKEAVDSDRVEPGTALLPLRQVPADASAYVLDGTLNDSFKAVNPLLGKGVPVRRADKPGPGIRPGDFLVAPAADAALLHSLPPISASISARPPARPATRRTC
jgi:hypothetical protein